MLSIGGEGASILFLRIWRISPLALGRLLPRWPDAPPLDLPGEFRLLSGCSRAFEVRNRPPIGG